MDFAPTRRSIAVASSDAANIATRAVQRGSRWVLDGHKRYISGADGPDEVHSMAIARRELRRHAPPGG